MKGIWVIFYPFSLIYGFVTWVRNKAYDWNILRSEQYDMPLICVGNLSMGGTGKTPHVEYLIRLLGKDCRIATLSRGYRRSTSGYILAGQGDTFETIGDEPLQYLTKYPWVKVAVDEHRNRGIQNLLREFPDLDVIILDDAFQHRKIMAGLNILLTDYHKPYFEDKVFPAGTLREYSCFASRADILIVTKTPKIFSPITRKSYREKIKPSPRQPLLYSYLNFGNEVPLTQAANLMKRKHFDGLLMVTGIVNPEPLEAHLQPRCQELMKITFPDHHAFTIKDIGLIRENFCKLFHEKKAIITTEKDAMRLSQADLARELSDLPVYYIPVEVEFHPVDKELFDRQILEYVRKNKGNHRVHPK